VSKSRTRQQVFLEMMQELDSFREDYVNRHQLQGLDREDPDLKRLTEAMGFFAARAQFAGQNYLAGMRKSLLKEFFPYLLSPVPSLVMLQAVPTARMSEVAVLKAGTVLTGGVAGKERTGIVRTLADLTVLPLELYRIDQHLDADKRMRLQLKFRGPYKRNDELGALKLFINQLGDYVASVRLHELLSENLEQAWIVFTEDEGTTIDPANGQPIELSFPDSQNSGQNVSWHPLELERWFFQLPERDLFVQLDIKKEPRNWRTFTVVIDIRDWPSSIRVSADAFRLFVVPVANLIRDFADPVMYDGTSETIAVRHPLRSQNYVPHSILGVYESKEGQFSPLDSGLISSGTSAFRMVADDASHAGRAPRISIDMPEAFDAPTTISVEALWHQPWFSELARERVEFRPYRTSGSKIRWDMASEIVPFVKPPDWGFDDEYLELFALQHKPRLQHAELKSLLGAMGPIGGRAFDSIVTLWTNTECVQLPHPRGNGWKTVFTFAFGPTPEELRPVAKAWTRHVGAVLDAWMAETVVETKVRFAQ
jgi:type VI secretion system protein ImpG